MGDFDCCSRGNDVPDPTAVALGKALTRVRETTARLSDAQSLIARIARDAVIQGDDWVHRYPEEYALARVHALVKEQPRDILNAALADAFEEGANAFAWAEAHGDSPAHYVMENNPYRKGN